MRNARRGFTSRKRRWEAFRKGRARWGLPRRRFRSFHRLILSVIPLCAGNTHGPADKFRIRHEAEMRLGVWAKFHDGFANQNQAPVLDAIKICPSTPAPSSRTL